MKKKHLDLLSGSAIILLSIALLVGSTRIKSLDVSRFGSGFFPAVVAGLLFILGAVILAGGIKKARGPEEKAEGEKPRAFGVLATFALMAAYAWLMPKLGFLIMTAIYLFLQMLILAPRDKRNYLGFGITSALTSLVVYYTFVKVFQLMLPAGILG